MTAVAVIFFYAGETIFEKTFVRAEWTKKAK